jgi:HEAT repeat protein
VFQRAQIQEVVIESLPQAKEEAQKEASGSPKTADDGKVSPFPQPDAETQKKFLSFLKLLEGEKPPSPAESAAVLAEIGPPVVPCILHYLCSRPEETLLDAMIDTLLRFRDDNTVSCLARLLSSSSPGVPAAAIRGLQLVGDLPALEALAEPLAGADAATSAAAGDAIAAILRRQPENRVGAARQEMPHPLLPRRIPQQARHPHAALEPFRLERPGEGCGGYLPGHPRDA